MAEQMNEVPEAALPLIDPNTDDGRVSVLADEGCNSICHGEQWRVRAEKIAPKYIQKARDTGANFVGIGNAKCNGVYKIHFAIQLEPSGLKLRGSFKSTELSGGTNPLLLSLPAQSKLGFIKDVRKGTCFLADYPGQRLPLARSTTTGLLMFCINQHLDETIIPKQMTTISDDDVEDYGISLVASGQPVEPKKKPIMIVTFGIENVGIADSSKRKSKELHKLTKSLGQGSYSFTLSNDSHIKTLEWDMRGNYLSSWVD